MSRGEEVGGPTAGRRTCPSRTGRREGRAAGVYDPPVSLTGKRVLITGGAGFIGTTLATRLVDENEVVAVDNLHRDALSGTDLAGHPNFLFVEGDVLDLERLTELAAGCTHIVHAAGIAGVDTVLASPVRTMRVNVIGTYNALEAGLATRSTLERIVEFSTTRRVASVVPMKPAPPVISTRFPVSDTGGS